MTHATPQASANAAPGVPGANGPPLCQLRDAAIPAAAGASTLVLEAVDWAVAREEFWVVAGLPGSGKSQLLQTAAGLVRPVRGGLELFGQDLTSLPSHELAALRRRIGFVFADGGRLFGHLSVAQNLSLPLCYHQQCTAAEAEERVARLLAALGLEAFAHWRPNRLNRGWQQRVALARALALGPEALFLDNPLAGLDPRQARWWLEWSARLRGGAPELGLPAMTLVVATDDLRPWRHGSARFGVLRETRFLAMGAYAELERRDDPHLRELLADLPGND